MTDPEAFVGRVAESTAYARAAKQYAQARADGSAARGFPRRNVIVFHGKGGMGKSRLLLRLRDWTVGDEGAPEGWGENPLAGWPRRVTTAYNLSDGLDVDVLMYRLRCAASRVGVEARAFDIGLLTLWSLTRPLEELPELDRTRHAAVWSMVESGAKAALAPLDIVPGVATITVGTAKRIITKLRREHRREETVAACERLPEALEELLDKDNAFGASALAALLDWDIDRAGGELRPCFVVFLDTFERVQGTRYLEAALNRMVHDTPRVLWVIGGRRRLEWADPPAAAAGFRGPEIWPALVESARDGAQFELYDLVEEDVERLVRTTLTDGRGSPAPEPLPIGAIMAVARGHPLAVALAIRQASRLLADGRPVDEASLGGSLRGILENIANDLRPPSRQALNAGSLVRAFDVDLLNVGARFAPGEGDGERFVREPLVERSDEAQLPYSVHGVVRREVREAPVEWHGAWTESGWRAAGDRMLAALRERHKTEEDSESRLALIGAAFDISCELDVPVPWLLDAAVAQGNKDRLIATIEGRSPGDADAPWSHAFERFVAAWAPHDSTTRAERFGAVAKHPGAGRAIRRYAMRFRAYELRTEGRHPEAEELFSRLRLEKDGELLQFQHALTLIHQGRFREADELAARLETVDEPTERTQSFASRLHGELRLQHGDLRPAAEASAARARYFEARNNDSNATEVRSAEARRKALLGDPGAPELVERVIRWTDENGALGLLRSAYCSKAICLAGGDEPVDEWIEKALAVGSATGAADVSLHEALAWTFDAAVRRDARAMEAAMERIAGSRGARDTRWSRTLGWWQAYTLGRPLEEHPDVQWLDPVDDVIERWTGVVEARAAR